MEIIWLFAFVFVAVIKPFHVANVTHIGVALNWWQTSEQCGNDGLEFRENILQKFSVLQRTRFWIGKAIYNRMSDWLEIIGCFTVTNTTGITELANVTSLGKCQYECKSISSKDISIYFGYDHTTSICICAKDKPAEKSEIKACTSKKNTYFFYQVYQQTVSDGQGGHCTIIYCNGGKNNLKAVDCSFDHATGRCENDDTTINRWNQPYSYYFNICKSNNQLLLSPSTYCSKAGHADLTINLWTNVFRQDFRAQLTKGEGGDDVPLKCLSGQLTEIDSKLKLSIAESNCSSTFNWFLCRNAKTESTIASVTVNVPSKSTVSSKKPSITTSFPVYKTSTEVNNRKHSSLSGTQKAVTETNTKTNERIAYTINSTSLSRVNKNGANKNKKEGSNSKAIGAVIGGLIGACTVIAVLAVLIVCKVRSIGFFRESSNHIKEESSPMQFSKAVYQDSNVTANKQSTTPTSNETYGLAENSTAVYAVVNKIKKSENISDTYTNAEDGEYDHLHDLQNRRIGQQENVYHRHGAPRNEEDQTYDSSDFGKEKIKDENGLYDQSFLVVEGEYSYSTNKNHDNTNDMGIYDKAS